MFPTTPLNPCLDRSVKPDVLLLSFLDYAVCLAQNDPEDS